MSLFTEEYTQPTTQARAATLRKPESLSDVSEEGGRACPLCGVELLSAESVDAHYREEVKRLARGCTNDGQMTLEKERSRREAAIRARKRVRGHAQLLLRRVGTDIDPESTESRDLQILQLVRARRLKREATPAESCSAPAEKLVVPSDTPNTPKCFMCGERIFGDDEDVNRHIDECLARESGLSNRQTRGRGRGRGSGRQRGRRRRSTSDRVVEVEDGTEVYEVGGQLRVRMCSVAEGDYAGISGAAVNRNLHGEGDVDDDLDVDEDGSKQFGFPQYTEADLITEEEDMPLDIDDTDTVAGPDPRTSLLVQSLQAKIRELERHFSTQYRCLICLSPYKQPVVSTNCWHVYCETCWMRALGSKRLCPQCQTITMPGDLRRIYLNSIDTHHSTGK